MTTATGASPRIGSRRTSAANLILSLVAAAVSACDQPAPHETAIGQWIWSSTDSALFVDAARSIPNLIPTVWIGTIRASADGKVESQLALSPRVSGRSTT